ncbi:helix-turn-helix domain-containing protein [Paenibacillus taichungensis]|uniref:helix-turn-helix domain-containing protein n=1 Tax=Paenibacillus taichungensis TaxID=484184 RepID=UPI0035E055B0
MIEGKIIKFYREKHRRTQGELVKGICSVTHLSKIERGMTEYSQEIMDMLCERLYIDMAREVTRYHQMNNVLDSWQEAIIMQRTAEAIRLKDKLEEEPLKGIPDLRLSYDLLQIRFYLFMNDIDEAERLIAEMEIPDESEHSYEHYFYHHVMGIYYFLTGHYTKSIQTLTSINQSKYTNHEYFYHLSLAYHSIYSNITSYYYAEKAIQHFRKTLNMVRIIDTETIMLVQLNSREYHDFPETKRRYENLIRICDDCGLTDRKAKLLNNLGYEYNRRNQYEDAVYWYRLALDIIPEKQPLYLMVLNNYIESNRLGNLIPANKLLDMSLKALHNSKLVADASYMELELQSVILQGQEQAYYEMIEERILPYYRELGSQYLAERYEEILFQYYMNHGEKDKALRLAKNRFKSQATLVI